MSYTWRRYINWKCVDQCRNSDKNLTQLLRFNAVKTKQGCDEFSRHSKFNESPLPVKNGILVHAKARKILLVEKLAAEGLSISNQRVQDIQKMLTD